MHIRYQGYWIKQSPFDSTYVWIEKDGHCLGTYSSIPAARAALEAETAKAGAV